MILIELYSTNDAVASLLIHFVILSALYFSKVPYSPLSFCSFCSTIARFWSDLSELVGANVKILLGSSSLIYADGICRQDL